MAISK